MDNQVEKIRLQKFLADSGIASRRKSEEYILDGRIKVNGQIVTELGTKVDPNVDVVEFDDIEVVPSNKYVYILLNKPSKALSNSFSSKSGKYFLNMYSFAVQLQLSNGCVNFHQKSL